MMKRNVLLLIVLLIISLVPVCAQNRMNVHLIDGTVYSFPINNVDHIDWDDETATFEDITINDKTYKLGMSGAIDLGLSVKWAAMNVGATVPGGLGDYYAWGETETKEDYSWNTYVDSPNRDGKSFTKYAVDKKTQLDMEDDVAHVKWGGDWRMPTKEEFDELQKKSTWYWLDLSDYGSHCGFVVVGSNGNAIFLPAAGNRYKNSLYDIDNNGSYWPSSLDSSGSSGAYYFFINPDNADWGYNSRYFGRSVRPVCP